MEKCDSIASQGEKWNSIVSQGEKCDSIVSQGEKCDSIASRVRSVFLWRHRRGVYSVKNREV